MKLITKLFLTTLLVISCQAVQWNMINDNLTPPPGVAWLGSTIPSADVNNNTDFWGKEVHIYRQFNPQLKAGDLEFINNGGILFYSYAATSDWSLSAGGDAKTNEKIRKSALQIKRAAPHKVMVCIRWEPTVHYDASENNTPENYKKMWANIQKIYADQGVDNVVWVMDYADNLCMGFDSDRDCNALWPGDDRVDWLFFNNFPYGKTHLFDKHCSAQYQFYLDNSQKGRDYKSKPWGLGAFGYGMMQTTESRQWYLEDVIEAIEDNAYPRFQAYIYFNSLTSVIWPPEADLYQQFVDLEIFNVQVVDDGTQSLLKNKLVSQNKVKNNLRRQ